MLDQADLLRKAAATGFRAEALEKAMRLLGLLQGLRSHPFLKSRMALKGGTALNLFVFDLPRLSVDVDINYVGATDRDTMVAERPSIEQAIQAVCGRLGLQARRRPSEHAGGKWRLTYESAQGHPGTLELDVNFLLRTPLWPCVLATSRPIGSSRTSEVPLLDVNELAAGKLAALFDRNAGRDLFDARNLLASGLLDPERLRLGFVVYGGLSRKDWREVSLDDIRADPTEVGSRLVPVLRGADAPARSEVGTWARSLTDTCRELLSGLLPLREHEVEFLTNLNLRGEITAELLTSDERLCTIIRRHPGLLWKAMNVRRYRGIAAPGAEEPNPGPDRSSQ